MNNGMDKIALISVIEMAIEEDTIFTENARKYLSMKFAELRLRSNIEEGLSGVEFVSNTKHRIKFLEGLRIEVSLGMPRVKILDDRDSNNNTYDRYVEDPDLVIYNLFYNEIKNKIKKEI